MTSPAELNPEGEGYEHSRARRFGGVVLPERERKKNSLQVVPARPDYRTSPVTEAFPWVVTMDRAIERFGLHPFAPIFLVVFTSNLKGDANPDYVRRLRELDEAAFEAASDAGRFLLHRAAEGVWFQNLGTGECNLSTTTKAPWLIAGDFRDYVPMCAGLPAHTKDICVRPRGDD